MALTIEQIQTNITNKMDARLIINQIADYIEANPGGGGGGVDSVTGDLVDNTDPLNPVIDLPNPLPAVDGSQLTNLPGGGGVTDITYANLLTAIAGSTLTAGTTYKITDRGDRGLFFHAISTNQLAKDGTRLMLCPATYEETTDGDGNVWKGVWNSGKTPATDDLIIHGGKVWKNLTGSIGTATSDILLDAVNWVLIPKTSFSNNEYVEMSFGVSFDLENDWIEKQWDGKRNILGLDFTFGNVEGYPGAWNPVDVSDWNYETSGNTFCNNECIGIWNNSCGAIFLNKIHKAISGNKNSGDILGNMNHGEITINSNDGSILDNMNIGNIINNSNSGDILDNFNNGNINGNNVNVLSIEGNYNNGAVNNNQNNGNIVSNRNNGTISGIGSANDNIIKNINNGSITTTTTGDITDTVVNK